MTKELLPASAHDGAYLRARIAEETARAHRYGHPFAVITFEAVPGADGVPLAQRLRHALETIASHVRPSDVVARLHDDTVALLLVETDGPGAHDALFRVRATLAGSGRWEIVSYAYPADAETIATIAA